MPPMPDDNLRIINFDVRVTITAPRTLRGWLAMRCYHLAVALGMDIQHKPRMVLNSRFGDLPTAIKDNLMAELLTDGDGMTIIGTTDEDTDD